MFIDPVSQKVLGAPGGANIAVAINVNLSRAAISQVGKGGLPALVREHSTLAGIEPDSSQA